MIKYPKLIAKAKEKLVCVREDILLRDAKLIESAEFAITIGKTTYTERVDAGTVMLEELSKCKTGEKCSIGEYKGFQLYVEKNYLTTNYMILKGKTEYKVEISSSPLGNMVKLEDAFNNIHTHEEFLLKKIEQYENDMETSRLQYEKTFDKENELKEKLARQNELNVMLDLENGSGEYVEDECETIGGNVAERGEYGVS